MTTGKRIRKSLQTKDPSVARLRAKELDEFYDTQWKALLIGETVETTEDQIARYEAALALVEQRGFQWCDADKIIIQPQELIRRALSLSVGPTRFEAQALMGTIARPAFVLSEAFEFYLEQTEEERAHKSPTQLRIILNTKRKAVNMLIKVIGNKSIEEITREDTLKFRDYLRQRVLDGELTAESANRDIGQLRVVLRTVCELKNLPMPPLDGLALKEAKKRRGENRAVLPFESNWIQDRLLKTGDTRASG